MHLLLLMNKSIHFCGRITAKREFKITKKITTKKKNKLLNECLVLMFVC